MNEPISELFAEELEAFSQRKEELLRLCEGKFALFKGTTFVGTFDTEVAAYRAGLGRFGNVPFLIQPVERETRAEWFPALDLGVLHAHP
jgi:epoxyqueuosine reductase QueG